MFWDTVHRLSVHFHIARGALYMALKITQPLLMYIWIFLLSVILEHTVMYMFVRSISTMYYFYILRYNDILIYSYNHVHPLGNENCGTEMTNMEIKMDF